MKFQDDSLHGSKLGAVAYQKLLGMLSWRLGHEKISTAIHPLLLVQEEQLSVTDERMCTQDW